MFSLLTAPALTLLLLAVVVGLGIAFVWVFWEIMATGESRYGKGDLLSVPGLTKDGRRISVELTIVLLHDQGRELIGTAAILRDATKRFEEIRELRCQLRKSSCSDAANANTASSPAKVGV